MQRDPWRAPRRTLRLPPTRGCVAWAVDDELRVHLEERIEELVSGGLSHTEAEAEAERRFGNVEENRRAMRVMDEDMVRMRR